MKVEAGHQPVARILSLLSLCIVALICLSVFTNPQQGGPFVILLMQLLLFLVTALGVYVATLVANRFIGTRIDRSRAVVGSVALGVGVILIAGLQTLNQLNLVDILLVLLLEAGVIFYAFRRLGSYKS